MKKKYKQIPCFICDKKDYFGVVIDYQNYIHLCSNCHYDFRQWKESTECFITYAWYVKNVSFLKRFKEIEKIIKKDK